MKKDESGQVLIIAALILPAALGLLALVVDGGFLYVARRYAVMAADAEALAEAQDCRGGSAPEVGWYADANWDGASTVSSGCHGNVVDVTVSRGVPTAWFGTRLVSASATARFEEGGTASCLVTGLNFPNASPMDLVSAGQAHGCDPVAPVGAAVVTGVGVTSSMYRTEDGVLYWVGPQRRNTTVSFDWQIDDGDLRLTA